MRPRPRFGIRVSDITGSATYPSHNVSQNTTLVESKGASVKSGAHRETDAT